MRGGGWGALEWPELASLNRQGSATVERLELEWVGVTGVREGMGKG